MIWFHFQLPSGQDVPVFDWKVWHCLNDVIHQRLVQKRSCWACPCSKDSIVSYDAFEIPFNNCFMPSVTISFNSVWTTSGRIPWCQLLSSDAPFSFWSFSTFWPEKRTPGQRSQRRRRKTSLPKFSLSFSGCDWLQVHLNLRLSSFLWPLSFSSVHIFYSCIVVVVKQ